MSQTGTSFCCNQAHQHCSISTLWLEMSGCGHTAWKAAVKLCFSPVMLNLLVLRKELVLVPDAVCHLTSAESRGC